MLASFYHVRPKHLNVFFIDSLSLSLSLSRSRSLLVCEFGSDWNLLKLEAKKASWYLHKNSKTRLTTARQRHTQGGVKKMCE